MGIRRMNHAVLYVRDANVSAAFYRDVLGFSVIAELGGGAGAFLRAPDSTNDHDIAFFSIGAGAGPSTAGRSSVGLYHVAWEVGTLAELVEAQDALGAAGALVGASDHGASKSLYAQDPDGLEFEVCWMVPRDLLADDDGPVTLPLDLDREIAHFGATTLGAS